MLVVLVSLVWGCSTVMLQLFGVYSSSDLIKISYSPCITPLGVLTLAHMVVGANYCFQNSWEVRKRTCITSPVKPIYVGAGLNS